LRGGDVELRVASGIKPGKLLIEAVALSHNFGDLKIVEKFNLKVMAGERIGLLGPNGIGKTTLLKMLLGDLTPESGHIKHGARLAPAFLTQLRSLNPKDKLKDVLSPSGSDHVHIGGTEPRHIISYMQDFLFDKELLNAQVGALSGGERGRLLLARLLLEPANLLVLDEPTNDLDIGTLNVLEEAIAKYQGTVIIVSHDRAFMDRTATKVLAFEGDGKIVPIEGGYSDYLAWKERRALDEKPEVVVKASAAAPVKEAPRKAHKLAYKEQKELDDLPANIEKWDAEKEAIEARFCETDYFTRDPDGFQKDQIRLSALEKDLELAYHRWEELETKQASF